MSARIPASQIQKEVTPTVRRIAAYRFAGLGGLPSLFNPLARFRALALWKRTLIALIALPALIAGGASGMYYLTLHQVSGEMQLAQLPVAARPEPPRRILVLSPHCDDETIALGGLIAEARSAGTEVSVAFLTNGDGFPLAAGRALGEVHLAPGDYVRFAEARQNESVDALGELGVPADHVIFLSYPDRGITPLWEDHWDAPFRSGYTDCVRSPYARAYTPGALHTGASLAADLGRLMDSVRPTDIYVTHPADDHPDHSTAAAFAQLALLRARDGGADWAARADLRYYLVHRGDWPLPQGLRPESPLLPPAGLRALDTRWESVPLSAPARAAKTRALSRYRSQMAVMRRFLSSFERTNELLGSLPERGAARAQPLMAASALPLPAPPPQGAPDAVGDNVVRYAGPSADLSGVSVEQTDRRTLRVRVWTRGPISPRVRYSLRLRLDTGDGATRFVSLELPSRPAPAGANVVETTLALPPPGTPGSAVAPRRVWVAAQTRWAGVLVDQTGFRLFGL